MKANSIEGLDLPAVFSVSFARLLSAEVDAATREGIPISTLLSAELVARLFERATQLLQTEPTLVEFDPPAQSVVHVVGDTHGHLHDVVGPLLTATGEPEADRNILVFNGDFVDRGAWGLELLVVLAAWKLALPSSVILLRGNHESVTCTKLYGFWQELQKKYGAAKGKVVFRQCKRLFAVLPLAACIAHNTLILHGGLFRKPVKRGKKRRRAGMSKPSQLGCLDDLRSSSKGGMDPSGLGSTAIAADVLWSDPVSEAGLHANESRGVGCIFGPDITEMFLLANQLRLVIRSHEGPDARCHRDDMPQMTSGWSQDHATTSGKLLTVFSAPDYPQFQLPGERYNNLGAVLRLSGPDYVAPCAIQFDASRPRPQAECYYDLGVPDSDEEIDMGDHASEMSAMTGDSGCCPSVGTLSGVCNEASPPADDEDDDEVVSQPSVPLRVEFSNVAPPPPLPPLPPPTTPAAASAASTAAQIAALGSCQPATAQTGLVAPGKAAAAMAQLSHSSPITAPEHLNRPRLDCSQPFAKEGSGRATDARGCISSSYRAAFADEYPAALATEASQPCVEESEAATHPIQDAERTNMMSSTESAGGLERRPADPAGCGRLP